ncbi:hypothetical protein ACMFMG_003301 [Clarireedia jacksonii]
MAASSAVKEVRIADEPATLASPSQHLIETPPTAYLLKSDHDAPAGIERHRIDFANAKELADHLSRDAVQSSRERLYILEGLPIDFVQVFGSHFDIDPEVFDSHAVRRSNRLSVSQRNATSSSRKMQTFALDYPEVTRSVLPWREVVTVDGDLMLPCNTTKILGPVHNAGVSHPALDMKFCHMTLLSFEMGDSGQHVYDQVLLLLDSASRVKMNGIQGSAFNPHSPLSAALRALPEEKRRWHPGFKEEAHQCFIELVVNSIISSPCPLEFKGVISLLTDLVLPQWKIAFDEFSVDRAILWRTFYGTVQQMYNLLDSNINMHNNKIMSTAGPHEITQQTLWIDLLKSIRRLTDLRAWARIADRTTTGKKYVDSGESDSGSDVDDDDYDKYSRHTARSRVHVRGGDIDVETKQSINRVTYLGGVLLPFSIVAAIFSMGDTYSPGGSHFFVFWVIAIPICGITTAMIYADSIRRMTVEQFASQYGAVIKEDDMTDSAASSLVGSDIYIKPSSRWQRFMETSRLSRLLRRRIAVRDDTSSGSVSNGSSYLSTSTSRSSIDLPPAAHRITPPHLTTPAYQCISTGREDVLDVPTVVPPTTKPHPLVSENLDRKKKRQRTWSSRFWRRWMPSVGAQHDLEHGGSITMGHDLNEKPGHAIPITTPNAVPTPSSLAYEPTSPAFEPSSPIAELDGSSPNPVVDGEPSAETPIAFIPHHRMDNRSKRSLLPIHIPTTHQNDPTPDPTSPLQPPSGPSVSGPGNDPWYPLSPQEASEAELYRKRRALREEARKLAEEETRKNTTTHRRKRVGFSDRPEYIIQTPSTPDGESKTADEVDPANIPLPPSPSDTEAYDNWTRQIKMEARARREQARKESEEIELREKEKTIGEFYRKADEEEHARRVAAEAEYARRHTEMDARERNKFERREALESEIDAIERAEIERLRAKEAELLAKERAETERRRAKEAELIAKEQAEMERRRARESKGKGRQEAADESGYQAPIKFTDAVGRKFTFPFHLVKTWAGMEGLIKTAFAHIDGIESHVLEGHYDLVGPEEEIILPQIWESVIQPGWAIRMLLWPMPDPPQRLPPSNPPRPPPSKLPITVPPPPPPNPIIIGNSHVFDDDRRTKSSKKSSKKKAPERNPAFRERMAARPRPLVDGFGGGYHHRNAYLETRPPGDYSDEDIGPVPMRRISRRYTDSPDLYNRAQGGRIITTDKPDEEMGWVRALGSIVGVKPIVRRGHGDTYLPARGHRSRLVDD